MNRDRPAPLGWALLASLLLFQIWLLQPELSLRPTPLNDDAFHIAASLKARDLLSAEPAGALDPWFSYWSLGYPLWHAYQPLPHLITGAAGLLTSPEGFPALYAFMKLLLLLLFPFCVLAGARWMGLGDGAAFAAALVSPFIATDGLYGLEYGSYLWRGSGLYTQLWAMDLLPLGLGLGVAALRGRASKIAAAALLALTFLCHSIYGWVAGVSLIVAAALLSREKGEAGPWGRAAAVFAAAGLLTAFFIVPMFHDGAAINHSRWESIWKWDSFGHEWVLSQLVKGELFDHGRLPILTILAAAGLALSWRRGAPAGSRLAAAGFLTWLCLYFGRPTWGVLLRLAGIPSDLHLHRLIGGVHLFGILLAGIALDSVVEWIETRLPARLKVAAAAGAVLLLLAPAAVERSGFVREGDAWAEASERAIAGERSDLDAVESKLREMQSAAPGRIYAGLAAGWGKEFKAGSVPLYARLSLRRLDALAFLYHAMSLTSDVMVLFDENRLVEYDIFDVRYALMDRSRTAPPFLKPAAGFGRFQIFDAPSTGHVGGGTLAFIAVGGRDDIYGFASAWMKSDLPVVRRYGIVRDRDPGREDVPVLHAGDPLPPLELPVTVAQVKVAHLTRAGDDWTADVEMQEPGVVFLKETFHPGWRVEIDGLPVPAVRITPGFVGAEIPAGRHAVAFRYRTGALKWALFFGGTIGFPLFIGGWKLARRTGKATPRAGEGTPAPETPARPAAGSRLRIATKILFLLIVLTGAAPLLQGKLTSGHDSLEYPPRLVEFHENVVHGNLAPIWAPDLGNGYGQPLFLFSPPLFYWAAEVFHLLGAGLSLSIGLGALFFFLAAGWGAFLAGREAWGRRGGLLTAAAFLLSPHVLLDLYVRGNFAELAAVTLFPWAALALLRLARSGGGGGRAVIPLAVAVASVALAHLGALAILLLWLALTAGALAWMRRDPRLPLRTLAASVLGVGLAAYFLIPCAAHLGATKAELLRTDFLSYDQHFVEPGQLLSSAWGYGLSVPGEGDGMSFSVGLVHLGLALAAAALMASGRRRNPEVGSSRTGPGLPIVLLGTAGLFALLTTSLAAGAWRAAAPLQYLAYPWRLLSAVSLSLALAAGALPAAPALKRAGLSRAALAFALLALLVWGYPKARPKEFLSFDDAYYAPGRIAFLGINTTTREEYEPAAVRRRPPHVEEGVEVDGGPAFVLSRTGTAWRRGFKVAAEGEATLTLNLFDFPGWEARLDGEHVEIGVREPDGRMLVPLTAGRHELEVALRDTPARVLGKSISALSLLLVALLWARGRRGTGSRFS